MLELRGKEVADRRREEIRQRLQVLAAQRCKPGLALVRLSEDAGARMYADFLAKSATKEGIAVRQIEPAAASSQAEALALIRALNADSEVDGVLLLMPLPDYADRRALLDALDPAKDIDGLTPTQAGLLATGRSDAFVPATARACMAILTHYGIETDGKEAVVIGRSDVIGKPVAQLLLAAQCTVTVCHSHTRNLSAVVQRADIVVAALGRAQAITKEMIRPGATVIDVGIHRTGGATVGDVDPAVGEVAAALTPVPGGVGAVTTTMMLEAVVRACERHAQ